MRNKALVSMYAARKDSVLLADKMAGGVTPEGLAAMCVSIWLGVIRDSHLASGSDAVCVPIRTALAVLPLWQPLRTRSPGTRDFSLGPAEIQEIAPGLSGRDYGV
jgi:hypothetical protein